MAKLSPIISAKLGKEKIVNIIRTLDTSKSSGYDGLSLQMITICDSSVTPIQIIFKTCIHDGTFLDKWKMPNVCPIHKKGAKKS